MVRYAVLLAALLVVACSPLRSGPSERVYDCGPPAVLDGTHPATVSYHLTDSGGADQSEEFATDVTVDQLGSALWYWGVVSEVCGKDHAFGSDRTDLSWVGKIFLVFSGVGSVETGYTELVVHGEIEDASGDVWYTWDAEWKILLDLAAGDTPLQKRSIRSVPEEELGATELRVLALMNSP